ncbi:MAG: M18 family aminopeptidase, partial [Fusobacteriaceae bacterium]
KGIKYQEFVNHSDERGGGTLGPVSAGHLDINSIDLGIPMLSMHSVKETAGTEDIISLKDLLKEFYSC